jgi:hypothetical protein
MCREFQETPVAKLFLAQTEWDTLRPHSLIRWLKDELVKRNPHKLVAQRKRQLEFLGDKMRRVPALTPQLNRLEAIKTDALMVFCSTNEPLAHATLEKLGALDAELQALGYKKLAVESTRLLGQMRYAMKETWGALSCQEVFAKMDADNDGYITTSELDKVFRELGMPNFSSEDLAAIFRLANEDGSDKMSWDNFEKTFDIPPPAGAESEMSPDDLLVVETEALIESVVGYNPGGKFAVIALNQMTGQPFGRCKEPGAAVEWFLSHMDDWFYFEDRRPVNNWHESPGGGNMTEEAPPGFHWKCFCSDECKSWGGTWNKRSDLFCTICKSRNPGSHSTN